MKKKPSKTTRPGEEEPGMKRLTVSFPAGLYAELEKLAARDSRSLGWIIRKSAEELVKQDQPLFHR